MSALFEVYIVVLGDTIHKIDPQVILYESCKCYGDKVGKEGREIAVELVI